MIFNLTQPLISSVPVLGKDFTWSGSDGTCLVIDDGGGNWRIKFLSSGVFTPLKDMTIDAFLVGGGAGGGNGILANAAPGGGSGYTTTVNSVQLTANTEYSIVVGAGGTATNNGGTSTAFEATANGGRSGSGSASSAKGGNGGSGGGGRDGEGGVDGANGGGVNGGTGQGTTTCEFGESTGDLYATGGGGSDSSTAEESGAPNTGDGGSGSRTVKAGEGGSGIVVIRKHKEAAA